MFHTDFDDFLDSDDDALFVEASNNLTDYDLTEATEKNSLQNKTKSVTSESLHTVEENVSQNKQNDISYHFKSQAISPLQTKSTVQDSGKCLSVSSENTVENLITISTSSVKLNTSSTPIWNKKAFTPESSYINNRFTPGFTPKAKKRKLPGPAGLLELFDESKEIDSGNSHKMLAMDIEFESIVSSQFTPERLSLLSWQKLQTAVSSCSNLHSAAKYYSIKRVLQESSKKKLPKHMIVPVLCVLLKKITYKGSTTISIFMDDTGEINGKIDAEVLSTYKEYIVEGAAFILKKVTFLCNILLLKAENLVIIYHPDGTEQHPQTLESILETSEPMKPMKCKCPKLLHHNMHKISKEQFISSNSTPYSYKSGCNSHNAKRLQNISNQNRTVNNNASNLNSKPNSSISKVPTHVESMRNDSFLEDLLDEGSCMDEFDELLGNLDEKSFMEDL